MRSRTVTIANALGLHARAAARFVHAASAFQCRVTVVRTDRAERTVDGKSILGLLLLAAAKGAAVRITADGPDEAEALDALCRFVESGFGEGAC
ncbi:MAG TPA: HPr family phosphocarrier protein [Vicinamibacterales bacterium]|nr:HPr family phosphocarrier protein [Vicinamibacterales bacterium]HOQ60533.1 HPr family phosphocarrier protein [Vicinamibacterales bacterium]HPK71877.1 HPr family phosphocarrier protein [Vicinamibacterales bacterium]